MELPTPDPQPPERCCTSAWPSRSSISASTPAIIEEVRDGGRTLIVAGEAFVLSALTAHDVRAGQPYYGVRLRLAGVAT